jgi:hypothetical protein
MQRYYDTVTDQRGNALAGARVAVQSGGSNVSIYSDNGVTQKTNPMTTDASGGFSFYAANGSYDLVVTSASGVVSSLPSRVRLFDVADSGLATSAALAASSGASLVGFVQSGAGAVARTAQDKARETVSVFDFMTAAQIADVQARTVLLDGTAAILAAASSVTSGGELRLPPGKYLFKRGTGTLLADTILADNVTISGPGAVITTYNAAGAIPNNSGNQYYNVFQATGRSNITIRDLSFEGYCTPVAVFSCDGVVVDNITDNGLLANAGGYLRDKTVFVDKCSNVRVVNSKFDNFAFAVYLSGDVTTQTNGVNVTGCHFEHTAAAGDYTALFPVGVYVYYANGVNATGNTFKNIYSSLDNGTTGTGMGYGVYEGDGSCKSLNVNSNIFQYDGKGSKKAIGVYVNQALNATTNGNTFREETSGGLSAAIRIDAKVAGCQRTVSGNTMDLAAAAFGIYFVPGGSHYACRLTASGNTINGGNNAIRCELPLGDYNLSNNACSGQATVGMHFLGVAGTPIRFPKLNGNTVTGSQQNAVQFGGYTVTPILTDNKLLDGNLSNQAGDLGAAVLLSTNSYGLIARNNTIGNTAPGAGLFTYGIQNVANASARIFKDITGGNTFLGLANNTQFGRFNTAAPSNGVFDINKGDFVENVQLDAGDSPGWHCVFTASPALSADASSASTAVTVSSTGSFAAGDVVLLTKDSDPYDADYYTVANWHVDTVASVTDATHFELTTGIPAGDGTYTAGAAAVRVARFKAAAVIAS